MMLLRLLVLSMCLSAALAGAQERAAGVLVEAPAASESQRSRFLSEDIWTDERRASVARCLSRRARSGGLLGAMGPSFEPVRLRVTVDDAGSVGEIERASPAVQSAACVERQLREVAFGAGPADSVHLRFTGLDADAVESRRLFERQVEARLLVDVRRPATVTETNLRQQLARELIAQQAAAARCATAASQLSFDVDGRRVAIGSAQAAEHRRVAACMRRVISRLPMVRSGHLSHWRISMSLPEGGPAREDGRMHPRFGVFLEDIGDTPEQMAERLRGELEPRRDRLRRCLRPGQLLYLVVEDGRIIQDFSEDQVPQEALIRCVAQHLERLPTVRSRNPARWRLSIGFEQRGNVGGAFGAGGLGIRGAGHGGAGGLGGLGAPRP